MLVPYGDDSVEVDLGAAEVTVAEPSGGVTVEPKTSAAAAMTDPHGPPLRNVVTAGDTVAIVVTDVTRATPDEVLVDALVKRLPVPRENIEIVIGLGLHRPMSDVEISDGLGEYAELAINHDPDNTVPVGEVDRVDGGTISIEINKTVAEADTVLATGMVEPHQYAGFSGGAKTVTIGAGAEPIIRYTHGPAMLARDGVRLGRVDGNPFRETLDRAGDLAGPDFCLNVTHGPTGTLGVAAGQPRAVVRELASTARDALSVSVDTLHDAVVAGVRAPKDANLYQASRAATYLLLGAFNPVKTGGRVILPAKLPEGPGEGTGEQRFYDRFQSATNAESLYQTMTEGYDPGAQRAFVSARALREHEIYVAGSDCPEIVEDCLMHATETVEEAIDPGSDVLVVPDALHTLIV